MLLRAYRITDRLGLVILKMSVGLSAALLDGVQILLGSGAGIFGTFFTRLAGIILAIALFLWSIVRGIGKMIWRLMMALFGLLGIATTRMAQSGGRSTGQAVRSAQGAASDAMARQAARAEMEVGLAEDPLRAQNRALSGLVVIALAALVVAVIWATSRPDETPFGTVVNDSNVNLSASNATAAPTVPGGVLLATPVPTATQLPEVLQVRGSLAFVAREGAQQDIWAVSVGGTNAIRLTNNPADERDPSWSPDGQRLAYSSHKDGNWEIYIQTLVGDEPTRMTYDLSFQANPVWSPDAAYLAYESYLGDNLDIYVMSLIDTTTPPRPLPSSTLAPEFSPAWSPDGRRIAYTSWQDGNQEIYVFSLDTLEAANLTNTPERNEDYAAWSPDGNLIAYSGVDGGIEKVFIKSANDPNSAAQVFRGGRMPFWSPDGNSLVYVVDSFEGTQFIVEPYQNEGLATPIMAVLLPAVDPTWTTAALPAALVNAGGLPPAVSEPLYREQFSTADAQPLYRLAAINNVSGLQSPFLADRVDDSFNALRAMVAQQAGLDFLGQLEAALLDINTLPQPGEERRSWLKTGRAFSINRNLLFGGFPVPIEVVREDTDLETSWRVYIRVSEDAQSGQLGEPLRRMPWQFANSAQGDVEAYDQGGRLQAQMPAGYYIDFTQLILDYGWQRMPAGADWRANALARNYWIFYKPDRLTWYDAMREIWPDGQLINFRPTDVPLPAPTPTVETGSGG